LKVRTTRIPVSYWQECAQNGVHDDTAAAESEEELVDIAVQYAVEAHGHRDTPAMREELRKMLRQQRKRRAA
jgi:hypothetical protein